LNKFYNSNKGEIFLTEFVKKFELNDINHQYGAGEMKKMLLNKEMIGNLENIYLLYQAKKGDMKEIRRSVAIGRSVNFRDYDSRTALHLAAAYGHFKVVKYLVNHGAVVTIKDRFGNTPIDEAKNNGYEEIHEFLIENQ
jgi:glutaminase